MRIVLALLLLASSARAEIAKLGGIAIGDTVAQPATQKTRLYGCTGNLRPNIDRKKKVTRVRYEATGCTMAAVAAAITKDVGIKPIASTGGDKLWEGKTAALLMTDHGGGAPVILLLPAGGGAKRACFSADGFAAFWSGFKSAVASGKADAVAAAFAFPLEDDSGKVIAKTAADFASHYAEWFDAADVKAIAGGTLTADCDAVLETYRLGLHSSYAALSATRVRGAWKWTHRLEVSPD